MVRRGQITDRAWEQIELLLPREAYRRRNVVERCMGRLKQWRSVATRYEKRAVNYRAMVVIASLMVWPPS